ncbi:MAG: hypothetical protein AAGE01_25000, partial [Pseudomonadota bacterium]
DDPELRTWAEWRMTPQLTARLELRNLLDRTRVLDRTLYATSVTAGDVAGFERLDEMDGRSVLLRFSGQF